MWGHVSDAELMDVVEGTVSPASSRHLLECRECAERVEEARAGRALAADDPFPEPSPLYWENLRREVDSRISTPASGKLWRPRIFAPVLALAASLLAALSLFVPTSRVSQPQAPAPLPAWSALPPSEEDDGLEVLQAMSLDELGPLGGGRDAAECVEGLSEEESRALADALRLELSSKGRL